MTIVVIRHGETALNRARVVQPQDTPLSPKGVQQAEALAGRMAERTVSAILCSDLLRARMTAGPIAQVCGVEPEYTELLRERDFGELAGTPYDELKVDLFAEGFHPPGGETWETFRSRAEVAFKLVTQRRAELDGDLLVVTHGLMCFSLVHGHASLPEGVEMPGYWYNSGVTLLGASPPFKLRLLNCASHLGYPPAEGISGI